MPQGPCIPTAKREHRGRQWGNDERHRSEERNTHPGCLLCANENASWKTLVSSKDREAPTTATSSTLDLLAMKPFSHEAICRADRRYSDRQKVREFCRPHSEILPRLFFGSSEEVLLRPRPSLNP